MEGYSQTDDPEHLVNANTGALIFVISADHFPRGAKASGGNGDADALRKALRLLSPNNGFKLYLIVIDDEAEALVKSTWMNDLQWLRDSPKTREDILASLREPFNGTSQWREISAFKNVASIIGDLEPASTIRLLARESVSAERVSYEIFRCDHRVRNEVAYYIHLHRGITISNTSRHLAAQHPEVAAAPGKMIVLSVEKGHVRPGDRVAHVKTAFACEAVEYLESLVSKLIRNAAVEAHVAGGRSAPRTFVKPQVRERPHHPPSDYSIVTSWLSGPQSGALILVGQGGIGKTWAMLNLRELITSGAMSFSRQIDRSVAFIASTDVTRGLGRGAFEEQGITLYDLYYASQMAASGDGSPASPLPKEMFYNALELGSLIVFVDGLDEVMTRYRSQFDPIHFFNDLSTRLSGESDGKVVISCRSLFFDQEDFRLYPGIKVLELLAFDTERRNEFLREALEGLPRKLEKATALSESLAALPDGRYVPFVLDLIKDVIRKEADGDEQEAIEPFNSDLLTSNNLNDRIVGQFCRRETGKTPDPIRSLPVDEQVRVFCRLARQMEAAKGGIHRAAFEAILESCLNKKEVGAYAEHFLSHPFISQEDYAQRQLVQFRFDFMPEYFLVLDATARIRADVPIDEEDIRIFTKFCAFNTPFCCGLVERLHYDDLEFYLKLMQMNEQATAVIAEGFPAEDADILRPDSAKAKFSYAVVSLLAAHESRNQPLQRERFTEALKQVFGGDRSLKGVVLLDGFVRDDERIRIDFRDVHVENSLFRAVDVWNCTYNKETVFSYCRFMNCPGSFAPSSGMQDATIDATCQVDEDFERTYARGHIKTRSTQDQNIEAIKSFIEDFYRQAHFRAVNKLNLERFYGKSNSVVPFKRLFALMKRHKVIDERDKGHYVEVAVARTAMAAAEQLITQNMLASPLEEIAIELRNSSH
ncbi:MAG TPA: hypothetical protein VF650_03485 [Allosphingosinicella sp.]